jgi:hypothetical protein
LTTLEIMLANYNYENQPALVLGSSPTIKIVKRFSFDGIRIGLGDMPVRAKEFGPYDFWVCANTYYPLPWNKRHQKDLENSGARTLIASMSALNSDVPDEVMINALEEIYKSKSDILYEQRHFHQLSCNPKKICCEVSARFKLGKPIQELLGRLVQSNKHIYSEGATVALHGYALAVLLRANPIYIAGVDLPNTTKNYRSYRHWFRPHENSLRKITRLFRDWRDSGKRLSDFGNTGMENILRDFQSIAKVANSLGIATYSLSKGSPLNEIEFIHFKDV